MRRIPLVIALVIALATFARPAYAAGFPTGVTASITSAAQSGQCSTKTPITNAFSTDGTKLAVHTVADVSYRSSTNPTGITVSCTTTVGLRAPAGWKFRITGVAVGGMFQGTTGVRADFSGSTIYAAVSKRHTISIMKPLTDFKGMSFLETVPFGSLPYSACGASTTLTLKNSVSVTRGNAGAGAAANIILLPNTYTLDWARC